MYCIAKGSKEEIGGKLVKLLFPFLTQRGLSSVNSRNIYYFAEQHFKDMFRKAEKGRSTLWVQQGDPTC